jgi:uncharacterized metal-binding protein YceD (DUF177 family)
MRAAAVEFSRLVEVSRIPPAGMDEVIEADADECARLAGRLGVERLLSLKARFNLMPWRQGGVRVRGRIEAEVEQVCVVSLEPFVQGLSEEVDRCFAGAAEPGWTGVVHHLDSLEEDTPDLVTDGEIDLGELAAETLVLAVDPYPRKAGAVFGGNLSGAADEPYESSQNPFRVLEKLTKK